MKSYLLIKKKKKKISTQSYKVDTSKTLNMHLHVFNSVDSLIILE